jgi:hypothetical protein
VENSVNADEYIVFMRDLNTVLPLSGDTVKHSISVYSLGCCLFLSGIDKCNVLLMYRVFCC